MALYYFHGKEGICIECGNHNDPMAINKARESAQAYLGYYGLIDYPEKIYDQEVYRASYAHITQLDIFKIAKSFQDFEAISKGQLLGFDAGNKILARHDGYILFGRDRDQKGVEAFIIIERE